MAFDLGKSYIVGAPIGFGLAHTVNYFFPRVFGPVRSTNTADTKHNVPFIEDQISAHERHKRKRNQFAPDLQSNRPRKRHKFFSPLTLPVARGQPASRTKNMSRRFRRRRSKRSSRSGTAMTVATKALRIARKNRRNVESKQYNSAIITITNVSTAGFVSSLLDVAQGDNSAQRDGDMIRPFFLNLRFHWKGKVAAINEIYRTIVFQDTRQQASTKPSVTDVLNLATPLSMTSPNHKGRWRILYDETFSLAGDAAVANNVVRVVNVKVPLPVSFTGATDDAWIKNGLFMLNITNISADMPDFVYVHRTWFKDP